MAARRNTKPQSRRAPAAATTKAAAKAAPVQTQAAEAAAEALLADARTKADAIITAALNEASDKARQANAEGDELRAQAERAADELHRQAASDADHVIASARAEADRLRTDADGQAVDRQAQAELAAQRTEKAAQTHAEQIREQAVADARRIVEEARGRYAQAVDNSLEEAGRIMRTAQADSEQLLAGVRIAAEQITADANRYAEARIGQAVANAKELQQQAVTDVAAGRQFREEGAEFKSATVALHAEAEQKLADASLRTARRLHRKNLKTEAKRARKQGRTTKPGVARLTVVHRLLIGLIILGAAVIAGIGFTGSYGAVRDLARDKGFGEFADVLPIGIDAGIGVLLALDLLLTWLRMPLPMLRHSAWILTGATVWFNAAASWPDPLGVGLHMAMPVLFVIVVEAARHAIGRLADVEAEQHTQTPKLIRWALAFRSTSRLWRRQHVWSVRDLNQAIEDEGQRLVYIRSLQTKYKIRRARTRKGAGWRQMASEVELMPLDLYDTGVAFSEALRRAQKGATASATQTATGRPEKRHGKQQAPATSTPQGAAAERPGGATKTGEAPATERPRGATKKSSKKRSGGATRAEAKAALRALYDSLGKRPQEGELVAELKKIGSEFDSRQYANKLRAEIETDEPHLVALGSDVVRPLTG